MKILHLLSQHPESTGSGFYLQNIIRQADARGHRNFLIAGISEATLPVLDGIDVSSCRFVRFGDNGLLDFTIPGMSDVMPYPSTRFSDLCSDMLGRYERVFTDTIVRAVNDFEPDIIHSHHLWLASSVARRLFPAIPMVTSCHSTEIRQLDQCPHICDQVLSACREINIILSLSSYQAEQVGRIYSVGHDRIRIVGGGYDEDIFRHCIKDASSSIHLLYAGKISYAKGVDWLLRTVKDIGERDIHLHLAGSGTGEEEQACYDLALAAGSSRVTVHGRISQYELAGLMRQCHIFILPSFFEGLPLVLLEALASGCRIITTDLPGCREVMAAADDDLVEFVALPRLKTVDSPYPEDMAMLEKRLRQGILNMVGRARISPSPDYGKVVEITSRFGWQTVFSRIEQAYKTAINS